MRKFILVISLVCLVIFDVVIFTEANTIFVPQEHKSIQAAIKAAKVGDTILVAPGIYQEELSLKDGVILKGAGEKSVLKSAVKAINVEDVVIIGFAMKGGTKNDHFGIFCRNAKVTIKDMTIWGFHHGISAETSEITVKHNTITNSFNVGILVTTDSSALIEGNQVTDNPDVGMIISSSDRKILLLDNTLKKNRSAGIQCSDASPIIRRNSITQNGFGISIDDAQADLGTVAEPGLNRIYGNEEGDVVNLGKDVVLAQQNYWGNPNGPCQNCIFGKVEYKPFMQQESLDEKQVIRPKAKLTVIWGRLKKASNSLP